MELSWLNPFYRERYIVTAEQPLNDSISNLTPWFTEPWVRKSLFDNDLPTGPDPIFIVGTTRRFYARDRVHPTTASLKCEVVGDSGRQFTTLAATARFASGHDQATWVLMAAIVVANMDRLTEGIVIALSFVPIWIAARWVSYQSVVFLVQFISATLSGSILTSKNETLANDEPPRKPLIVRLISKPMTRTMVRTAILVVGAALIVLPSRDSIAGIAIVSLITFWVVDSVLDRIEPIPPGNGILTIVQLVCLFLFIIAVDLFAESNGILGWVIAVLAGAAALLSICWDVARSRSPRQLRAGENTKGLAR